MSADLAVLIRTFSAAGYNVDTARSRSALLSLAGHALVSRTGRSATWRWHVPGRVELFGKHTDYAGGRSLVCAVPRGLAVAAAPRDDDFVRVFDAIDGREVVVPASSTGAVTGWGNYVATVVRRLASNFPGAPIGLDLVFASDLPRAAGLSSSSALVVAVALALSKRGALPQRSEWRTTIGSPQHLAWYLGCVESGRDYPGLPGAMGVGTLGGSEDHTAILTCSPGHVSLNRYAPVEHLRDVTWPADWALIVATSDVRAEKTGAAQEKYNRLSRATEALLTVWRTRTGRTDPTLARALASHRDAAAQLRSLVDRHDDALFTPRDLLRRLAQFEREDARTDDAATAIAAADRPRLGALSADTQHDARDLLANQVPETEALVAAARSAGAWAASSFGAGFGGSVWAITDRAHADDFGHRWIADYRLRCPEAVNARWFDALPGPGAIEIGEDVTDGATGL